MKIDNILSESKNLLINNKYNKALTLLELNKFKFCDSAELFFLIGNIHFHFEDFDKALINFKTSLSLLPSNPFTMNNIGMCYQRKGYQSLAYNFFQKAKNFNNEYPLFLYNLINNFPKIYKDENEVEKYSSLFENGINNLLTNLKKFLPHKLLLEEMIYAFTNFSLPYTGRNVLKNQKLYAQFYESITRSYFQDVKEYKILKNSNKKIKVGFFSNFFWNHTVNKEFLNFVIKTNKKKFDIFTFYFGTKKDHLTDLIKNNSKFYKSSNLQEMIIKIYEEKLDYLIFYDIGMTQESQILSSFRLAKTQCMLWGHPVSSCFKNIDYFISSELMEPADSNKHYNEKLLKLPNLGICYSNDLKDYKEISFNEKSLLVNQSLFKILPRQDKYFSLILKNLPDFKIHFINSTNIIETKKLKKRMKKVFIKDGIDLKRLVFLERTTEQGFLNYIKKAKIILDTFNWSGGLTSLFSLSMNKPVVTLPSSFMRGRHTYAMLKLLDLDCLIANDEQQYIDIATKLAVDKNFYEECCEKIKNNKFKLFDDMEVIKEFEKFLIKNRH